MGNVGALLNIFGIGLQRIMRGRICQIQEQRVRGRVVVVLSNHLDGLVGEEGCGMLGMINIRHVTFASP